VTRLRTLTPWLGGLIALLIVVLTGTPAWLTALGDDVVIPAGFWAGVAFVAYYTLLAPWWRNPFGRLIVQLDVAFMLVTLEPALQVQFGVTFSSGVEVRILVTALLIAAITIISRIFYLGALHGWLPRLPWQHARDAE
jgi:hypothetical protein